MQDYRRRHFDEDDRRDRYEGGRQRGEGQGPHGDMDDARYAGHGDGWRGEDDRGTRGGWRGDDERWTGRASQRDYGQYGQGGSREGGQAGRGSPGGWGHEWGGYSGGRSGGDWSGGSYGSGREFAARSQDWPGSRGEWAGGRSDWESYGGRAGSGMPGPGSEGRSGGGDWSSYRGRAGGDWGSGGRSMGMGGTELGGYGQQSGSESGRGAWRPSGQGYAGRGPRDYRRSDDRIREDISDRLTDDDRIDASDISVQVQNCEVTLTGTVNDREQKRCAEDLAERVSGVKEVTNNIRVSRAQTGDRPAGASGGRGKSSAG
jgi:hypothetical protein